MVPNLKKDSQVCCDLDINYSCCALCLVNNESVFIHVLLYAGKQWDVKAKCVINATGPYTDTIRKFDDPTIKNICQPSSGIHIILPEYYRFD